MIKQNKLMSGFKDYLRVTGSWNDHITWSCRRNQIKMVQMTNTVLKHLSFSTKVIIQCEKHIDLQNTT